jgi:predicted RNA-binding Zn-ribbon protein involved in translation (DUF1610 family)
VDEMTELVMEIKDGLTLKKVYVILICKKCGHEWSVKVSPTGRLPWGSDVCTSCEHNLKGTEKS